MHRICKGGVLPHLTPVGALHTRSSLGLWKETALGWIGISRCARRGCGSNAEYQFVKSCCLDTPEIPHIHPGPPRCLHFPNPKVLMPGPAKVSAGFRPVRHRMQLFLTVRTAEPWGLSLSLWGTRKQLAQYHRATSHHGQHSNRRVSDSRPFLIRHVYEQAIVSHRPAGPAVPLSPPTALSLLAPSASVSPSHWEHLVTVGLWLRPLGNPTWTQAMAQDMFIEEFSMKRLHSLRWDPTQCHYSISQGGSSRDTDEGLLGARRGTINCTSCTRSSMQKGKCTCMSPWCLEDEFQFKCAPYVSTLHVCLYSCLSQGFSSCSDCSPL